MSDAELAELLGRGKSWSTWQEAAVLLSDHVRELSFLYESSLIVMSCLFKRIDELQAQQAQLRDARLREASEARWRDEGRQ